MSLPWSVTSVSHAEVAGVWAAGASARRFWALSLDTTAPTGTGLDSALANSRSICCQRRWPSPSAATHSGVATSAARTPRARSRGEGVRPIGTRRLARGRAREPHREGEQQRAQRQQARAERRGHDRARECGGLQRHRDGAGAARPVDPDLDPIRAAPEQPERRVPQLGVARHARRGRPAAARRSASASRNEPPAPRPAQPAGRQPGCRPARAPGRSAAAGSPPEPGRRPARPSKNTLGLPDVCARRQSAGERQRETSSAARALIAAPRAAPRRARDPRAPTRPRARPRVALVPGRDG